MRAHQLVAVLLFAAASVLRAQEPTGQFGPYHWANKQLRLPDRTVVTVYRVKYWSFDGGQPPALQLEFEAPVPVTDTAGVHRFVTRIWPSFAPYVEHLGLSTAILTATNLTRRGAPPGPWTATSKNFGFIVQRDGAGRWFVEDDRTRTPLPPSLGPANLRIYEPTGARMRLVERPAAR